MPKAHDQWIERIYQERGVFSPSSLSLTDLLESEWDEEFERLMRNRLLMGAFRYGVLEEKRTGKSRFFYTKDAIRRLLEYGERPNLEILIDVSNMMLLQFVQDRKTVPFIPVDDGVHTQRER